MKEILESSNRLLIAKYDAYYIRFKGGQHAEIPCDLRITKEEAEKIMGKPDVLDHILNAYQKKMRWTAETFIQSGLEEYLFYEGKYTLREISLMMERLNRYARIKDEMYESIMYEAFPVNGAYRVGSKIAKDFFDENSPSVGLAYIKLLEYAEMQEGIG